MNSVEGPEPLADQPVLPAVRHHELLLRVLHGTFWMLNSNVFGRALNLARGVILARLLVPMISGCSAWRTWCSDLRRCSAMRAYSIHMELWAYLRAL